METTDKKDIIKKKWDTPEIIITNFFSTNGEIAGVDDDFGGGYLAS